ncbi:hypothetical protein Tel_02810 [Candidatus Tenderia electrophaga]|jgi:L-threonylcarbamoyladenylate synthase|uniref:Threonylcarbamoyl-AMP synthase n=1 Tax=Candidatus Tenderia electrophaga TaxID=1748243 RepID=A0A0S2TAH8_9GAMM|nr:hypothetical protein Tel_02810 [Candidatus Tenderia electrophaga]
MRPWQLRRAVRALRHGGVIAYPTETVFGLGCDPLDALAVERILDLKQRPAEKGLILIGATLEQLLPYIAVDDAALLNKLAAPQARATTWICPLRTRVPSWLCGSHSSIAVRITNSPVARQLCRQFGSALVSTSANPAGLRPASDALTVRRYFGDRLDYILSDRCDRHARPSRIVDLVSDTVIRA